MATQWIPLTRFEPKSWLLANGEIVKEPAMEQTSTGRKVRVAGTTDSMYASELEECIGKAVQAVAKSKGTSVVIPLEDWRRQEVNALGFDPTVTKAKMHLIHDPTNQRGTTTAWWRFKHPTLAFEVVLYSQMIGSPAANQPGRQVIQTSIVIPGINHYGSGLGASWTKTADAGFTNYLSMARYADGFDEYKWREFVRDNPPSWATNWLDTITSPTQRHAVTEYLKIVREFESYEAIQIPDLTNPSAAPAWLDLELYETNVNAELVADLTDYLDSAPTIEQVAELYDTMLQTLRGAGINVSGKSSNDFLAALLAGDKASLNMDVLALAEGEFQIDHMHKLSVHLPTGTFIVECSHATGDKDTVAHEWEEARTMAALTGDEPELLAYARAYAKEKNDKRTKQILKERKPPVLS